MLGFTYFKKSKLGAIFFIVLNLLCFNIPAQNNLIPNGSFENFDTCPNIGLGAINKAIPWFQPNFPYAGLGGSSDFHHFCAGYNCSSFMQCPRSGQGMAGISLFTFPTLYNTDYWREYIEVKLIDSLIFGKKYCIKFYVNLVDLSCYPIKQIQALLTNDSLTYTSPDYVYIPNVTPIVEADSIINDSINWIKISTTFIANGGEQFLIIGNFSKGDSVNYISICPNILSNSLPGYYLIDDVSIYEQPTVFAGNDTLIQVGDSVQIGIPGRPDVFYSWSPAAGLSNPSIANPIAHPLISTLYILSVTDTNDLSCTTKYYDTVRVWVGTVGVIESTNENDNRVKLYPNPSQNIVYYETQLNDYESGILLFYDVIGNQVMVQQLNAGYNKLNIDISTLSNGLYLYRLFVNSEFAGQNKLIIQR